MVFGEERGRVCASMVRDPRVDNVDVLTSAILDFPSGQCVFTASTQVQGQQSMWFYGSSGRIAPEVPFNAAPREMARVIIDDGRDLTGPGPVVEEIPPCNQSTIPAALSSLAIP